MTAPTIHQTSPERFIPEIPEVVERMRFIRGSEHFLPVTPEETHRAANLLVDQHAGARHIGEVLRHQVKARDTRKAEITEQVGYHDQTILDDISPTIDPSQGARRVLWTIGQFAIRARSDRTMLMHLSKDATQISNGNRSVAEERQDVQDGLTEYPNGFKYGLPELIRFRDLSRVADGRKVPEQTKVHQILEDGDGYLIGDVYTVAPNQDDVVAYLDHEIARLRLMDVRRNIGPAITDQYNRERFWRSILASVEGYQVSKELKSVAHRILLSLDIAKR
jgi:hypothetical protein